MIYLDNASTTNKKPLSVKLAIWRAFQKKFCANPGRSSHKYSLNAGNVVFETREYLNKFFGNDCVSNVIFTGGCTEALNLAIFGTMKEGGNVIYTTNEHNSVARPLEYLKSIGHITTTLVKTDKTGKTDPREIEKAIKSDTYLVIVNHTSNVTGATSDIHKIGEICHKHKVLFLVDGAQSAGHKVINMKNDHISLLAVAGHKGLLASQGIGVLLFDKDTKVSPMKFGGTGTYSENLLPPISYPESLEAGTAPTPAIFSLLAGAKYVSKHFYKINTKIESLTKYLLEKLLQNDKITLFTDKNSLNGVVSFRVNNVATSDVVSYFNDNGVCVRGGLHCAPLCHKQLGTIDGGTIRVSISSFNHKWEIKKFLKLLDKFLLEIEN